MSLANRNAIVTGSGSGIGRAIAVRLAADGAAVAVWDIDAEGAGETVRMIEAAGGRALAVSVDVSSAAGIENAAQQTRDQLGPVTVIVNNAGITGNSPFEKLREQEWDRMISINLKGPFLCTQQVIGDMLAAGWGRIINITSSSIQTGAAGKAHYTSAKAGLMGLTKVLAVEFADKGITANMIPPGFIDTPMLRSDTAVDVDSYAATTLMKRAGLPEDIAGACSYLASEDANYVTGQTISVNGGRYMGSA